MSEFESFCYPPIADFTEAAKPATSFGAGEYSLPGHDRKLVLEHKFNHTRDSGIRFIEKPHLYMVRQPDGGEHQIFNSVTSVAHTGSAPFDCVTIIQGMQKPSSAFKQRWPRCGYCTDEVTIPAEAITDGTGIISKGRGIMMVSVVDGKLFTHASMDSRAVNSAGLGGGTIRQLQVALEQNRCRKQTCGLVRYVTFKRALKFEEITEKWRLDADEASARGTEGHFQAELFMNGLKMHESLELNVCLDFVRRHLLPTGARPYRTEWEIYTDLAGDGGEAISGSVDLIVKYPNGSLGIIDWKRSKDLLGGMWGFGNGSGRMPPLDHLDDCHGVGYALQLNIYAYIVERYYGFKVESLTLCSIHPDRPYSTDVPRLPLETAYLMALERRKAAKHFALRDRSELLCQLTRAVRTHPMIHPETRHVVQHGSLYSHDVPERDEYVVDESAVRALEMAMLEIDTPDQDAEVAAAVSALQAGRVSWRELVPKPGLIDCMRNPITRAVVGQKHPRDDMISN
jgi:hypothetical protein